MDLPRSSGLLLHLTSLPSRFGVGDLGPAAYRFVDLLAEAGQSVWQMLPVVPVGHGYSPYASPSTFAGNPLLISPEALKAAGLLSDDDLAALPAFPVGAVDFEQVIPYKNALLGRAFDRFEAHAPEEARTALARFRAEEAFWLDDYALFEALKATHDGGSWTGWPPPLRHREPEALAEAHAQHTRDVRRHTFVQYLFAQQWQALRAYAHRRGVRLFGDLPIYVAHDSADVWSNPELFFLDDSGEPTVVSGVPPDYFSATGQRWGNPLYRWDVMQAAGFSWWTRRIERALALVDLLRLDHFRGFAAYWEVPAEEDTALNGRWVDAPGEALFAEIEKALGRLSLLAENLGIITDDVTALMARFGFPGMAVLQFGFSGGPASEHLPHHYPHALVAYPGTHDNDTLRGYWSTAPEADRAFARRYLALPHDDALTEQALRLLMASVAALVVVPVQDLLGLGSEARLNTPGVESGNWTWRLTPEAFARLATDAAPALRTLVHLYDRLPLSVEGSQVEG